MTPEEKKIEDYPHLYLGCDVMFRNKVRMLLGILKSENSVMLSYDSEGIQTVSDSEIKLILRPLSDMSEEEGEKWREISLLNPDPIECDAERTSYLLSKHFDLFGLVEAGLAIDKTKKNKL